VRPVRVPLLWPRLMEMWSTGGLNDVPRPPLCWGRVSEVWSQAVVMMPALITHVQQWSDAALTYGRASCPKHKRTLMY